MKDSVSAYLSILLEKIQEETGIDTTKIRYPRGLHRAIENLAKTGRIDKILNGNWKTDEMQEFIKYFSIPEGYFFRYKEQFAFLKRIILQRLIEIKTDGFSILSIGCGRGEELGSIAITVIESSDEETIKKIEIQGVDINKEFVESFYKQEYTKGSFRDYERNDEIKARYFEHTGRLRWRLKERVLKHIKVIHSNIVDKNSEVFKKTYDCIFFRNVAIYLEKSRLKEVFENLYNCLKIEGFLFLGHADIINEISTYYKPVPGYNFVYRKHNAHQGKMHNKLSKEQVSTQEFDKTSPDAEFKYRKENIDVAETDIREGILAFNAGKYNLAKEIFIKHKNNSFSNPYSLLGLAFIHYEKGDIKEAEEILHKIINEYPLTPEAYYLAGLISQNRKNDEDALMWFNKALFLNPELPQVRLANALIFFNLKKDEIAIKEIELASISLKEELNYKTFLPKGGIPSLRNFIEQLLDIQKTNF